MTGLSMSKPWVPLTAENIAAVPAQLGVYEIADEAGTILLIGYAGGREAFGLRTALTAQMDSPPPGGGSRPHFRVELNHGYLTRWEELLMVHQALHGALPVGNADHLHQVGRLTLGQ